MNKLSHVAFIMDGNGRWGKKEKRGRNYGHLKGVEIVKKVVEGSLRLKIKHLTFYVFSTENWKRPKSEINYLFKLIFLYFTKELKNVIKNGIKISIIGNINPLPSKLKKSIITLNTRFISFLEIFCLLYGIFCLAIKVFRLILYYFF